VSNTAIHRVQESEAEQLISAIEKNAIDGHSKQDTGYLLKILPDVRKLRALIAGKGKKT
jgi:hypothetical protein